MLSAFMDQPQNKKDSVQTIWLSLRPVWKIKDFLMNLIDPIEGIGVGMAPYQMSPLIHHHGLTTNTFSPRYKMVERHSREMVRGHPPSASELKGFWKCA